MLPRALFITHTPPVYQCTGTYTRAALMLVAVATSYRVTLVLIPREPNEWVPAAEALAAPVENYHILRRTTETGELRSFRELTDSLNQLFEVGSFELLFVFRAECSLFTLKLVQRCRRRYLDVDELLSFRQDNFMAVHHFLGGQKAAVERGVHHRAIQLIEKRNLLDFDQLFVCSDVEREHVRTLHPGLPCAVVPNIAPVVAPLPFPGGLEPFTYLFIGNCFYPPNQDAALWFATTIFPLIRARTRHAVACHIVGFGGSETLAALRGLEGVHLLGYLPDVRLAYEHSHVSVVPLRAGAGTRIKILEAFAFGRPVISTAVGAEGLRVNDGIELLLRDNEASFADGCVQLLESAETRELLVRNGQRFHRDKHTEAVGIQHFQVIDQQWNR